MIHFEALIHTWLQPGDLETLAPPSRFNGFQLKPLETVRKSKVRIVTWLKPGVNDTRCLSK